MVNNFKRLAAVGVAAVLLGGGLAGCRSGNSAQSVDSYLSSPAVVDASLLPASVPAVPVTAATAQQVASGLVVQAHASGSAGLTALVKLAEASGMPVLDASQGGKVVVPLAGSSETFPVEAGQLVTVHELLASGVTTSLSGILDLLSDDVPDGTTYTPADMGAAISSDLRSDESSDVAAVRVWADAIIDSSPQGTQLLAGSDTDNVQLDGLQSLFLLLALQSSAETQVKAIKTSSVAGGNPTRAVLAGSDSTGGCNLADEVNQELLDSSFEAAGGAREALLDAWFEHMIEEGAPLARRQLFANLVGTILPIFDMIFAKAMFSASVDPANPSFERTKRDDIDADEVLLTATFQFLPKDNSHLSHCVALFMTGMIGDVSVPASGAMHNLGVKWNLTSGGGVDGFVQLCATGGQATDGTQDPCGGKNSSLNSYTDEHGVSLQAVQGKRQKQDLSASNNGYQRHATVNVSINPKDVEDNVAHTIKTLTDAASTALSIAFAPAFIAKMAEHFFYDVGALNVTKTVDVTDWTIGMTLHYTLTVEHYNNAPPGFSDGETGQWVVSATVPLTLQKDGTWQGSGAAKYTEDTWEGGYGSGAHDVGSTPGTLQVTMNPLIDSSGTIFGVHDLTYTLSGLSETEDNGQGVLFTTNYVMQAFNSDIMNALHESGGISLTSGGPYTRSGFKLGNTSSVISTLEVASPSGDGGYEGAIDETFEVDLGNP